jgi:hypothetical protein
MEAPDDNCRTGDAGAQHRFLGADLTDEAHQRSAADQVPRARGDGAKRRGNRVTSANFSERVVSRLRPARTERFTVRGLAQRGVSLTASLGGAKTGRRQIHEVQQRWLPKMAPTTANLAQGSRVLIP